MALFKVMVARKLTLRKGLTVEASSPKDARDKASRFSCEELSDDDFDIERDGQDVTILEEPADPGSQVDC